jgi:hypothetical protein
VKWFANTAIMVCGLLLSSSSAVNAGSAGQSGVGDTDSYHAKLTESVSIDISFDDPIGSAAIIPR